MHLLSVYAVKAWAWVVSDAAHSSAVQALVTVVLGLVTIWYVILTRGMAKAMARQTQAMIQPVASLEIVVPSSDNLKGLFYIKNLGVQPFMLLDAKLTMHYEGRTFVRHPTNYDKNIVTPKERFTMRFEFTDDLSEGRPSWGLIPDSVWYDLAVVTSDISKDVVLTYRIWTSDRSSSCKSGMPLEVRWRYFSKPFKRSYNRWKFRLDRLMKKQ